MSSQNHRRVIIIDPKDRLKFPPRRDAVKGVTWAIYVEPMVASGERFCVGAVAVAKDSALVVKTPGLDCITQVYGAVGHEFLQQTTDMVLESLRTQLAEQDVRDFLLDTQSHSVTNQQAWFGRIKMQAAIEGFPFSALRQGEGNSLAEIATTMLMMSSSLVTREQLDGLLREHDGEEQPKAGGK